MYTFFTHFYVMILDREFTSATKGLLFPLLCCFIGLYHEVLSEIMFLSVSQVIETKSVFQNCFRFCSAIGGGRAQNSCCTTKQLAKQQNSMPLGILSFASFICLKSLIR